MKTRYKYIHFFQREDEAVWDCFNNKHGDWLGVVKFHGGWGKFAFSADYDAAFSEDCLADIQHFMSQLEKPE